MYGYYTGFIQKYRGCQHARQKDVGLLVGWCCCAAYNCTRKSVILKEVSQQAMKGEEMSRNIEYINWYTSKNYDRLNVFLPKGSREMIKQEAKANGMSLNEFIRRLIPERLIAEREYIGKVERKK